MDDEAQVSLLSDQDKKKIQTWNKLAPQQASCCVHELIQERCLAQPDGVAVCAWDGDFTYGELHNLSSALAAQLAEMYVGPEMFIPLCFEKSRWTAVAMFGVMKAGAAFVLLDPSHPQSRLQDICQGVSARIILASTQNALMASNLASQVITVGNGYSEWNGINNDQQRSSASVTSENALYAVFTSGSTGKPKGVVVEHASFHAAVAPYAQALNLSHDSRVFLFASYAFDVCIFDTLIVFIMGGCICVPSETDRLSDIGKATSHFRITHASFTPTVAKILDPTYLPTLKTLVLGGEMLPPADLVKWVNRVHVINLYGASECPLVTMTQCQLGTDSKLCHIRHETGSVCWIVHPDDHEKLMPIGMEGELLIQGPTVGRGYLNDPQRTAATFITNQPRWLAQFDGSNSAGQLRLYKTGDLAKYAPDGSIQVLGRKDTQVKLRGQRIELSEVEHHVRKCFQGARDVVAELVTPIDSARPPILVAFVWDDSQQRNAVNNCRKLENGPDSIFAVPTVEFCSKVSPAETQLNESVPSYMVPSAFIPLCTIPMTRTGKTDRRQLREQAAQTDLDLYRGVKTAKRMPDTATEKTLQQLWASVLGINTSSIGLDDSFLQIGGDSIGAMRLVGAARGQGLSFTVQDLFNQPRLCELAKLVKSNGIDTEEVIAPFSLLKAGLDESIARTQAAAMCGIELAQIEDMFPCTPLQEGLLAMTARRPGDYLARNVLKLQNTINIDCFQKACQTVALRMPILRTRMVDIPHQGLTQVLVNEQIKWLNGENLGAYLCEDDQRQVGLGMPLAWFGIVQDNKDGGCFFVWTVHHALCDGWLVSMLMKELELAYKGEKGQAFAPFQSFIKYVTDMDQRSTASYWRAQLAGSEAAVFPPLQSSLYQPRADSTLRHHIRELQWPQNDITASTAVRAAWSILAAQYTGSTEVIYGVTVTGRQAAVPGIEHMAGPTIATVPVRVVFDWNQSVEELQQQLQAQAMNMTAFEQMGLQTIRRISQDMNERSQFQTLLVVQPANYEGSKQGDDDLFMRTTKESLDSDHGGLNIFNVYALMLECRLEKRGLQLHISFDSNVIRDKQVQRLAQQLEYVLQQVCKPSPMKLRNVEAVSGQDLRDIWTWHATVPASVDACIHDLISETTHRQPDALAICAWDGSLTYRELDELSTRLAHQLIYLGVGPSVIVPLCFEKSMWMPIAMLAVMKAGGASVAMDSCQPVERLRSIVQQVDSQFILSSSRNQNLASQLTNSTVVVVDRTHLMRLHWPTKPTLPVVKPSSNLYINFTSGSTGEPKGAIISHQNFSSAIHYQRAIRGIGPMSRVFDFASYSFDAAWSNLLVPLICGGCLCIPSDLTRKDDLAASMRQMRVNYVELTPSTARIISPAMVPELDTLALMGEPYLLDDVQKWRSEVQLINMYGPCECTQASTMQRISQNEQGDPSIGRGIGCNTWVADSSNHERLVPLGCTGELLIEGPIVGRGYLSDVEKTAAAFVHDPPWLLSGGPGFPGRRGRLYKTGDLVRYNPDGTLVFLGRKDTQVKIRGQRVELGEIEHAVQQCFPEARQVVAEVIMPKGKSSSPTVAAFILINNITETNRPGPITPTIIPVSAEVRTKLAERLLSFMMPAMFFSMRELPMTASGKVDRRWLRENSSPLWMAAAEQSFDISNGLISGGGGVILNTEQPAHALARKVFSMVPSWRRNDAESENDKMPSDCKALDNLLLLYSGLDSVNMMTFIYFILQQFRVKVGMQTLLDPKTSIRTLARIISDSQAAPRSKSVGAVLAHSSPSLDLMAEINRHDSDIATVQRAVLNPAIAKSHEAETTRKPSDKKLLTVLLTGANGYIGTQILRQALEHCQVGLVIAIVRGKTANAARSRTIDSAKKARWWTEFHEEKLRVWLGDLSLPKLGLDSTHWSILTDGKTVDVIIQNGAAVHWGKSYAALEDTNVISTVELLRLAVVASQHTRFVYVTGGRLKITQDKPEEDEIRDLTTGNFDGYAQTKFVAEAVVKRAALRSISRPIHIAIVSPGIVVGTPTEGIPNADDFIWRLVAACIRAGSYNASDANTWLLVSDAATTAKITVDTALDPAKAPGAMTRIRDGMTWGEFWAIIQGMGYRLLAKHEAEWLSAIREDIEVNRETHPLWPVAHVFEMEAQVTKQLAGSESVRGSTPLTLKVAVKRCAELLGKIGFLPLPLAVSEDAEQPKITPAFSRS